MFTGIIQEIGVIRRIDRGVKTVLSIYAPKLAKSAYLGGSICVNGACLSVTKISGEVLDFDAIPETIAHTNLSKLKIEDHVNLEPAMQANSRFDGHIVQGHVDKTGIIREIQKNPGEVRITIQADEDFVKHCIHKGSVAIDGISLTIASILDEMSFEVAIIPTSLAETTLKFRKAGDSVNLESDVMLKYVENILKRQSTHETHTKSNINESWLRELGY